MKYKVGDKVRVVANTLDHGFEVGTIGIITGEYQDAYVVTDIDGEYWYLGDEEVEPC